jgi:hypothetical protein
MPLVAVHYTKYIERSFYRQAKPVDKIYKREKIGKDKRMS